MEDFGLMLLFTWIHVNAHPPLKRPGSVLNRGVFVMNYGKKRMCHQ